MARILTLDGALGTVSAGLVEGDALVAAHNDPAGAQVLAVLVERLLAEHGGGFEVVAVTVGPGSFTGLRAALSLAHGLGLAAGADVRGVTTGAAIAATLGAGIAGRALWTATDSKRGRVYLERDGVVSSAALDDLPRPPGPVAVAGDAAGLVADRLAGSGVDAIALAVRGAGPLGIARAAMSGPTRAALPLYVDPPEARPGPAGRPPPA